jgi:ABC-type transport system involved in multi-copper enzyme maturation permease subunit
MAQSFLQFPARRSLIHRLKAHAIGRARRFAQRSVFALSAWAHPDANPFLQKALRVEARRHKPFFEVAVVALCALLACVVIGRLWLYLQFQIESAPRGTWNYTLLLRRQDWLIGVFGKHPLGWFALITAFISACGVLWSSRSRAAYLLRRELLKNTLVQLQQLPIAEERWVWLLSAHPALMGVLIGLCGLPIYSLAIFVGQWSVLDCCGLLMVFFLLGHAAPAWMPAAWQQQNAKTKPNKLTWQQWRELTQQSQRVAQSGDIGSTLESQRRLQRAAGGLAEEYSSANSSDRNAFFVAGAGNTPRGGFSPWWGIVAFNVFFQMAKGAGFGPLQQLTESWPREVVALLPGFLLAWPLIFAKLLVAPLPFFAFHFPPSFLILPLWVGVCHQNFVTLAAHVSAAETFWTRRRLQRREAVQWLLAAGALLFIFGYGWPVLVEGGELAHFIRGATPTPAWALCALWTLALAPGTLVAGLQMEAPFKRALHNESPGDAGDLRAAWRESTRRIVRILLFSIGAYFIGCFLGARSGINTLWLHRLPVTLCTCIAFLLADFGSGALGTTLPAGLRRLSSLFRVLWFHGLGITAAFLFGRAALQNKAFSFDDAPYVLLSPFVTLFSLFRAGAPHSIFQQPFLWLALLMQAVAGVLCLSLAHRAIFSRPVEALATPANTARLPVRQWKWLAPLFALERILMWPLQFPLKWLQEFAGVVNGWNEAILQWGEKFDNPILTYELRRRLRKESWAWQWLGLFAGEAILFCVIAQPWQLIWTGAQIRPTVSAVAYNNFADWGETVTYAVLILMAIIGVLACLGIGCTFDSDRANGTLVFLYLTPQTDREILIGKWASGMLYVCGVLSTGLVWLGIGVLIAAAPGLSVLIFWLALCGTVALVTTVFLASTINLFFAVRAKKPTDGQSRALLSYIVVGVALTFFCALIINISDMINWNAGDEIKATVLLLLAALVQVVIAALVWKLTLRAFAKRRYGDVEASGKGAS